MSDDDPFAPMASYDDVYIDVDDELEVPASQRDDVVVIPPPTNPMAVGRRFVDDHYLHELGEMLLRRHGGDFYRWNGACWPAVPDADLRSRIYSWLEPARYDKRNPKTGAVEQVPWEPTKPRVDFVVDALRAVTHLASELEPPAWLARSDDRSDPTDLVVMANGLLHLPTRTLLTHTPDLWVHHSLPFSYDPTAPEPKRWLQFLRELWGDDDESIAGLQEIVGYLLSGDTRLQKMFLLVGPKRSGKGTIGRVVTGLLGAHNVAAPTLSSMATNFGIAPLIDHPLAIVSDARLSSRSDSSIVVERLLSISGEDSLTVDRKFRDPWTGRIPTRFMILTNELPRLSDSSGALASRFVVLVLTTSFFEREDPTLTTQLLGEATGIFNWALDGLDRLRDRGYFHQPTAGREAIEALEDLASPIATFVRERCIVGPALQVPVDELYAAWRSWSEQEGSTDAGTKAAFGRDLRAAVPGLRKRRLGTDERTMVYVGLRLRPHSGLREQSPVTVTHRDVERDVTARHGDAPMPAYNDDRPDGTKLRDAITFVTEFLADGPRLSADLNAAADLVGIKYGTLTRARSKLSVHAVKNGFQGRYVALPHHNPEGEP